MTAKQTSLKDFVIMSNYMPVKNMNEICSMFSTAIFKMFAQELIIRCYLI